MTFLPGGMSVCFPDFGFLLLKKQIVTFGPRFSFTSRAYGVDLHLPGPRSAPWGLPRYALLAPIARRTHSRNRAPRRGARSRRLAGEPCARDSRTRTVRPAPP